MADGEVVWSWRPDAGAKFLRSKLLRNDGGKTARSPGRARYKLLKPLRREGWMIRLYLWFYRVLFVARGPRVRWAPGFPCALTCKRAGNSGSNLAQTCGEIAKLCLLFSISPLFHGDRVGVRALEPHALRRPLPDHGIPTKCPQFRTPSRILSSPLPRFFTAALPPLSSVFG